LQLANRAETKSEGRAPRNESSLLHDSQRKGQIFPQFEFRVPQEHSTQLTSWLSTQEENNFIQNTIRGQDFQEKRKKQCCQKSKVIELALSS